MLLRIWCGKFTLINFNPLKTNKLVYMLCEFLGFEYELLLRDYKFSKTKQTLGNNIQLNWY